jgi:hypothetical protein
VQTRALPSEALRLFVSGALALLLTTLAACTSTDLRNSCTADSECKSATATKCIRGRCGCESNTQCGADQFCNLDGSCQARVGCQSSLDCPKGEFCDTSSGNCIGVAHCTKDVQCDLGKICDRTSFTCVNGCLEAGDCPLGDVCQCPDGSATCTQKQCVSGPCADDTYCQYGQTCETDPSGGPSRCVTDTRGPFCGQCNVAPGEPGYCGADARNYCLVDTTKGFAASFCGVDCSEPGQTCPFGFECSDVLILTSSTCGGSNGCPLLPKSVCAADADCAGMGACVSGRCTCSSDANCPAGQCDTATGQCHGICSVNEGSVQGFCTCLRNEDCPSDRCGANRTCSITGKQCDPTDPQSCGQIFCKKVMDPLSKQLFGYCFIGQNCAPENGVTCDQVTSQN